MVRSLIAALILLTTVDTTISVAMEDENASAKKFRRLDNQKLLGEDQPVSESIPSPWATLCNGRRRDKPEAIRDAKKLAAVFKDASIRKRVAAAIDFEREQLVLTAWKGWSDEKVHLQPSQDEDHPVLIVEPFVDEPRSPQAVQKHHIYLFAIPKDCKWSFHRQPGPKLHPIDPGGVIP